MSNDVGPHHLMFLRQVLTLGLYKLSGQTGLAELNTKIATNSTPLGYIA